MSAECAREVVQIIEETEVDIEADPLLERACALDLLKYCRDLDHGAGRRKLNIIPNYLCPCVSVPSGTRAFFRDKLKPLSFPVYKLLLLEFHSNPSTGCRNTKTKSLQVIDNYPEKLPCSREMLNKTAIFLYHFVTSSRSKNWAISVLIRK